MTNPFIFVDHQAHQRGGQQIQHDSDLLFSFDFLSFAYEAYEAKFR